MERAGGKARVRCEVQGTSHAQPGGVKGGTWGKYPLKIKPGSGRAVRNVCAEKLLLFTGGSEERAALGEAVFVCLHISLCLSQLPLLCSPARATGADSDGRSPELG